MRKFLVFTDFIIAVVSSSKTMLLIPSFSARTTLSEQSHTLVATPTQRPSSLRKTRPKPQWAASKGCTSTLSFRSFLGGSSNSCCYGAPRVVQKLAFFGFGLQRCSYDNREAFSELYLWPQQQVRLCFKIF
jgi:hypothetical protein